MCHYRVLQFCICNHRATEKDECKKHILPGFLARRIPCKSTTSPRTEYHWAFCATCEDTIRRYRLSQIVVADVFQTFRRRHNYHGPLLISVRLGYPTAQRDLIHDMPATQDMYTAQHAAACELGDQLGPAIDEHVAAARAAAANRPSPHSSDISLGTHAGDSPPPIPMHSKPSLPYSLSHQPPRRDVDMESGPSSVRPTRIANSDGGHQSQLPVSEPEAHFSHVYPPLLRRVETIEPNSQGRRSTDTDVVDLDSQNPPLSTRFYPRYSQDFEGSPRHEVVEPESPYPVESRSPEEMHLINQDALENPSGPSPGYLRLLRLDVSEADAWANTYGRLHPSDRLVQALRRSVSPPPRPTRMTPRAIRRQEGEEFGFDVEQSARRFTSAFQGLPRRSNSNSTELFRSASLSAEGPRHSGNYASRPSRYRRPQTGLLTIFMDVADAPEYNGGECTVAKAPKRAEGELPNAPRVDSSIPEHATDLILSPTRYDPRGE
jgi:hypothetical protein